MQKVKYFLIILISLTSLILTGCLDYDFSRRIVQQGNLLPPKKIEKLKIGMSKEEVAILMGTSLLDPVFNNDRIEYAYTYRRGTGPILIKNLVLCFKNDKLVKILNKK